MEEKMINAVQMVRNIRNANYEKLAAMSPEERIAFYREGAKRMNEKARKIMPKTARFPLVKARQGTQPFDLESEAVTLMAEDAANVGCA